MKFYEKRSILIVFTISLLLGFLLGIPNFLNPERSFQTDSFEYEDLALSLLHHLKFPSLIRTPVYPLFITIIYAFFGQMLAAVIFIQIVINSISAILVFLIGKSIINHKIGLICGLTYAINPLPLFYSTQLMTENIFTFLILFGIFHFLKFLIRKRPLNIVISALSFGVASLCRPISLFLPLLLIVCLFLFLKSSFKTKSFYSFIFLLSYILILSPWITRNYIKYQIITVSTQAQYNFIFYNAAAVIAERDNISLKEASLTIKKEILEKGRKNKPDLKLEDITYIFEYPDLIKIKELRKTAINESIRIIKTYPKLYLKTHILGAVKIVIFPPLGIFQTNRHFYGSDPEAIGEMDETFRSKLLTNGDISSILSGVRERLARLPFLSKFTWGYSIIFMIFQYLLILFSIGNFIKDPTKGHYLIFFVIVIFYFLILPGTAGNNRFRVPIEPYLSILAGFGLGVVLNISKISNLLKKD